MSPISDNEPIVLRITLDDVIDALGKGLRDFQALPLYGLSFGGFYAAGGIVLVLGIAAFGMSYLAYPLAAGFALAGPFVATALCELSRQREARQRPSLDATLAAIRNRRETGSMACVTVFTVMLGLYQAHLLMALFFGFDKSFSSPQQFIATALTTNEGLAFFAAANLAGGALSLILFSVTVVSFPLLLDRDDVDCTTAMITSVRAVATNPVPMIGWAVLATMLMAVSALPFFLSLMVTLPVLGHANWHLYRRVIARPIASAH